ncbi:unnamed protein product [Parascedosporium putredinis]|uniref:RNA helicase n=1 Tax=Parascedosporium putredinis TaxID=1442378 RepID=A0A9P1M572_9PEZI|nr:unnamed protein product [Parascedosporium putredinis]CAI7987789.1 unnamed protein product [Parascedosporium putredinis]
MAAMLEFRTQGYNPYAVKFDTNDAQYDIAWSEINERQLVAACGDGSIKLFDIGVAQALVVAYEDEFDNDAPGRKLHIQRGVLSLEPRTRFVCVERFAAANIRPPYACDGQVPLDRCLGPGEVLTHDWNKYNHSLIATGGVDKLVRTFDIRNPTGGPVSLMEGHGYAVRRVAWSPHESDVLISASYDMTVRVWTDGSKYPRDPSSPVLRGKQIGLMNRHTEFATGVDWSRCSGSPENVVEEAPQETPKTLRFEDAEGIHPNLIRAITQDLGYEYMTDVQEKTVRAGLRGTDLVAQARTGTGKTIAFLLPMLQRMIDEDPSLAFRQSKKRARSDDIRGIVISPTRELAEQIAVEAKALARHTGLMVHLAVGGQRKDTMLRAVQNQGCHLLVATPGRLKDILEDERSGVDAPNLAALVLDEADRMLDVGFSDALRDIQDLLPRMEEKERQTLLFSATIPKNVVSLAKTMVRRDKFEFIVVAPSQANIFPALYELMDREIANSRETPGARPFKAIVYYSLTAMVKLATEVDHSMKRLRADTHRYPPPTTSMAFSSKAPVPARPTRSDGPNREQYIHRLGRTGRQNKDGEGWFFVTRAEAREAKEKVGDLGLVPDNTLESAKVEADAEEAELLPSSRKARFGQSRGNPQAIVDDMNKWTKVTWGWENPPVVASAWVNKMGFGRPRDNGDFDSFQQAFEGADHGRSRRDGRDGRDGRNRNRSRVGDRSPGLAADSMTRVAGSMIRAADSRIATRPAIPSGKRTTL